jgi:hypothetical protein
MSTGLWSPTTAIPLEEFVGRVRRQIESYAVSADIEQAYVEVELGDGARFPIEDISAEPGSGFVTISPHSGAPGDLPGRMIVPVSWIRRIELSPAAENRESLGFSLALPWHGP